MVPQYTRRFRSRCKWRSDYQANRRIARGSEDETFVRCEDFELRRVGPTEKEER
jgi:hypothetical protein